MSRGLASVVASTDDAGPLWRCDGTLCSWQCGLRLDGLLLRAELLDAVSEFPRRPVTLVRTGLRQHYQLQRRSPRLDSDAERCDATGVAHLVADDGHADAEPSAAGAQRQPEIHSVGSRVEARAGARGQLGCRHEQGTVLLPGRRLTAASSRDYCCVSHCLLLACK